MTWSHLRSLPKRINSAQTKQRLQEAIAYHRRIHHLDSPERVLTKEELARIIKEHRTTFPRQRTTTKAGPMLSYPTNWHEEALWLEARALELDVSVVTLRRAVRNAQRRKPRPKNWVTEGDVGSQHRRRPPVKSADKRHSRTHAETTRAGGDEIGSRG